MTKIQIVNDRDQLIGFKERQDIVNDQDIYRISALWLENSKGEILLAQRKFDKKNDPGKWGPAVAGTIEEDETYESNIYKEAEEEVGLTGVDFQIGPKVFMTRPHKYFCQWYTTVLDWPIEKFAAQQDEVEALRWIGKEELRQDLVEKPESYLSTMPEILRVIDKLRF